MRAEIQVAQGDTRTTIEFTGVPLSTGWAMARFVTHNLTTDQPHRTTCSFVGTRRLRGKRLTKTTLSKSNHHSTLLVLQTWVDGVLDIYPPLAQLTERLALGSRKMGDFIAQSPACH